MRGLLLYNREDYIRNVQYIKWLIEEAWKNNIRLEFKLKEDFLVNGLEEPKKYDFVINRTRSYETSLTFELNNIRVFNNSTVTLLGNNKLAAYNYAKKKGYTYPKVLVSWQEDQKIISKPNFGHGGEGIGLIQDVCLNDGLVRLQQEFVEELQGDIRFYIINNKVIHGVLRKARGKIVSNFSQGGDIEIYNFSNKEREYIEEFISDISVDYAGIDFLLTKDNKLIFNEIEDVVGSRMLSKLGVNNTTELYLKHIGNQLKTS